jgi:hypothetical protein
VLQTAHRSRYPEPVRKLLYAPFGVLAGIIGAKLGRKVFDGVWSKFDDREAPPSPIKGESDWRKAIAGAALEGAAYAGTKAAVNRVSAKSFHHLTGLWPEKSEPAAVGDDA